MDLGLRLDWTRCPDGVEVFERKLEDDEAYSLELARVGHPDRVIDLSQTSGKFVRFKSEARETLCLGESDSLVLKFASANTEERLLKFMSDYGLPDWQPTPERTPDTEEDAQILEYWASLPEGFALERIEREQAAMRKLVKSPASFADQFEASVVVRMPAGGLMLQPRTLIEFMKLEAALIACGHAEIITCSHCGSFLTRGWGTRTDAKYCSTRCRVAAHRLRKSTAAKSRKK